MTKQTRKKKQQVTPKNAIIWDLWRRCRRTTTRGHCRVMGGRHSETLRTAMKYCQVMKKRFPLPSVRKLLQLQLRWYDQKMTNFDVERFEALWNVFQDHFARTNYVGRGRRSSLYGKDEFFITMCALKHGGQWNVLVRLLKIKRPKFERLVTRLFQLLSTFLYKELVTSIFDSYSMGWLLDKNQLLCSFPCVFHATYFTVQQ